MPGTSNDFPSPSSNCSSTVSGIQTPEPSTKGPNDDSNVDPEENQALQHGNITGDTPPQDFALGLDHVLEKIFNSLTVGDLLNCRLQSHRWNYFATQELKKHEILLVFNQYAPPGKCFEELASLLQEAGEEIHTNLSPLPCCAFIFFINFNFYQNQSRKPNTICIDDLALQNFFSNPRVHIKKLLLDLHSEDDANEEEIMNKVSQLLIAQSPHLETLTLNFPCNKVVNWKDDELFRTQKSPLRKSDPEFFEIHSKYSPQNYQPLKKLKMLYMVNQSAKIVEMMVLLAPNLGEVFGASDKLIYLLEPINRIYLLKKLILVINSYEIVELSEKVAEANEEKKIQLRNLDLSFDSSYIRVANENLKRRVENVISTFLECSCDSLETISFYSVDCLAGLKWPKKMSNLKEISLRKLFHLNGINVFPVGFNLAATFPSLLSVKISNVLNVGKLGEFIDYLDPAPVNSVTDFSIHMNLLRRLTPRQFLKLQQVFPNAGIS